MIVFYVNAMRHLKIPALALLLACLGCASTTPETGPKIRVAVRKGNLKIHEIPLERYLMGVVAKEVLPDWPIDALKAQAVASRTYALYRMKHPRDPRYDLEADTGDQVFVKKRKHAESVERAVLETEGETISFGGDVFPAFFHSCCGGMSERADRVWPETDLPPLLQVHKDPFCRACPRLHWDLSIGREELSGLLAANGYRLGDKWVPEVSKRDESGRVTEITFRSDQGDLKIPGETFRQILGYNRLRSTLFEIADGGDPVVFTGRGSGHGVGLCQWGAKGMADEGRSYREILEFYYPGTVLTNGSEKPETDEIGKMIEEE